MAVKEHKSLIGMRNNPKDWTIEEVETVCKSVPGVIFRAPRGGGSHYKVTHPQVSEILTIPARRPIKPVYIRDFVSMMDSIIDSEKQKEAAKAAGKEPEGKDE